MGKAATKALVLIGFVGLVGFVQGGDEKITALLKDQLKSAQKAFELNWRSYQTNIRLAADPEGICLWSKRWLNAEQALAKKKSEKISALENHLARIKMVEETVAKLSKVEASQIRQLAMVTFFRLEAEVLLAEAKRGSKSKEK
jgi:hypothetical protein